MEILSRTSTREQIATELLARSLRAWFDAQGADGFDAYELGLRDAYRDAAALTMDPTGALVDDLAAAVEHEVALHCSRSGAEQVAAVAVRKALSTTRSPRPRVHWVGPLAFGRQHAGPPGVDHDYGDDWGELGDVRVSWRAAPGATVGLLYAYDPTWNEYATLAVDIPKATVDQTVAAIRAAGGQAEVESLLGTLDFPARAVSRIEPPSPVLQAEL